ncbi:hypothetical protein [Heliomicrobium modesticaldum]|uniref:hypothetical protein n=1 Tax=Heliomicrobium modesticaldum TaxID=35701 RepID=UPI0003041A55|nr:hypothetical protein [Heliomicrobium modesticaldum]
MAKLTLLLLFPLDGSAGAGKAFLRETGPGEVQITLLPGEGWPKGRLRLLLSPCSEALREKLVHLGRIVDGHLLAAWEPEPGPPFRTRRLKSFPMQQPFSLIAVLDENDGPARLFHGRRSTAAENPRSALPVERG